MMPIWFRGPTSKDSAFTDSDMTDDEKKLRMALAKIADLAGKIPDTPDSVYITVSNHLRDIKEVALDALAVRE
jgi:hypothetical protein